jgi:BlaI family transcriptional regulator, penicillinase repressor
MPRKKTSGLTDAELRLMEVLWRSGPSTVTDVVAALPADLPLAYSSVLTTLRILETKGYLRHRKDGRAFIYEPIVARDEVRENAVAHLLRRFFENSPEQLMLNLIDGRKISAKQLQRLRKRIEEAGK